MDSLSALRQKIESLPKGNIYRKVIKGHEYWYHQYFLSGKRYSVLLANDEVEAYRNGIKLRKELEQEWERRIAAKRVTLSARARELTGSLMAGDYCVAKFEHGNLLWMDEKRAPLMLKRTKSVEAFLSSRVIDSGRTNARLLKKALNIHETEESMVSLYAYGASIVDHFWFKPLNSRLTFADICFDNDALFDLALNGDISLFPRKGILSPELTTTGSFEKGWKRKDNSWCLYKKATKEEAFSELYCADAARLFHVPSVTYGYEDGCVYSRNFAERFDFEPMIAIAGDDDSYEHVYECLTKYGENIQLQYLSLVLFDAVMNNVDRHNENCGLLRDRDTGEILSLAPSFDCNLALISRNRVLSANPARDGLIQLLVKFLKSVSSDIRCEIPEAIVTSEALQDCLEKVPKELWPENYGEILEAIEIRTKYLMDAIKR